MDGSSSAPDERRALRTALALSESRFHNIIEKNLDGILVMSPGGLIRYANPAATELLERSPDELVGTFFGIPMVPGETTEIDLPLATGAVRVADMRVTETDWEGERALLATLRDVSVRKALENQLRQKVEELADADRRKDEFLATLAHELRNPLAPIRNAVYILKQRGRDATLLARTSEIIEQEVNSLTRLVDDLLDVSRIRTGKLALRPEMTSLRVVIERTIASARPLLESKGHSLHMSIPEGPISLFADPVRIEQILVNLLTNAAKYTDSGGRIEVLARFRERTVELAIRDNGVGIAPEMLGRIFQLFEQADQDLDRSLGGLGIGLTLARRLAALHGGRLTASSAGPGKGSEFLLILPLTTDPSSTHRIVSEAVGQQSASGCRVLVVDDHAAMTESLTGVLRFWGHECRVARSGLAAIEEARSFHPAFILLDIGMPGMDGFEVARLLLQTACTPRPRLVAMSGYARPEDRMRGQEAGFESYLVKPVDLAVLRKLIDRRDPDC